MSVYSVNIKDWRHAQFFSTTTLAEVRFSTNSRAFRNIPNKTFQHYFYNFGLPVIWSLIAGFTGVVSTEVKIPSAVRVLPGSEDRKTLTLEKTNKPTFYEKSMWVIENLNNYFTCCWFYRFEGSRDRTTSVTSTNMPTCWNNKRTILKLKHVKSLIN